MLQVSALRSAIQYIKSLQSLVADCDAGTLDQDIYQTSAALDTAARAANNKSDNNNRNDKSNKKKNSKRKSSANNRSRKSSSSSDKWTNYSQNYLKQKFTSSSSDSVSVPGSSGLAAGGGGEHIPGSPRDVNEISLHISLLDNVSNMQHGNTPHTFYILQLDNKGFQQ